MADNDRQRNPPAAPAASTPAAPAAAPMTTEQQLSLTMAALAESNKRIADLMEQQAAYNREALKIAPRRRKTMGEYLQEKPRKRLLHDVYQNGHLVNPKGLSKDTIELLDTLATGTYCDGLVQVVRIKDGLNGVNSRIHIVYNNKSIEQRMVVYMRFPTFTKMVNEIATEMKALGIAPVKEAVADPVVEEFPEL